MAQIGSLGDITFEASSSLVRTFSEYSSDAAARIEGHAIGGSIPVLEFIGPDTQNIDIPVTLNSLLGVDVESDISKLSGYCQNGKLLTLILAGKPVGGAGAKWMLDSVNVSRKEFDVKGNALLAEVSISLKLARTSSTPTPPTGTITKSNVTKRRNT